MSTDNPSLPSGSFANGDQRNPPVSEQRGNPYNEGQPNSHNTLDSKDGRSIAQRLAAQSNQPDSSHHHNNETNDEAEQSKQDPTKPAKMHGNKPSKGAQIDAELKADDERRLREKGIKH